MPVRRSTKDSRSHVVQFSFPLAMPSVRYARGVFGDTATSLRCKTQLFPMRQILSRLNIRPSAAGPLLFRTIASCNEKE